ncbi:MAG: chorismate mutase [Candidatus Eisenbacteria bacterium]
MPRKKLQELRKEMRRLDGEILKLAKKRTDLARQVGKVKLASGFPVRDFETEAEVLEFAEERCRKQGIDPGLGRTIFRALIRGAVREQEAIHEKRFLGSKREITILGGRGKMGSWLAHYFYSRGHRVLIHDPEGPLAGFRSTTSFEKAVDQAEILVVSVPLHGAAQIYRKIRKRKPKGVVVDLFSLKSPVLDEIWLGLDEGLAITSIHPLFGPDVYLLSDRILVHCPCGNPRADRAVSDLFTDTSLETVKIPVEEHDRAIGIVLGLAHAVNIIFTEALVRSGFPARDLHRLGTTTFEKQVATSSEVAGENPRLYYDIQHLNEHTPEVFRLFERAFEVFRKASLGNSSRSFEAMMSRGRRFYEDL